MAWTYSGDPSKSERDRLRFELGDVDSADPLLQDEEADYCLKVEATFLGALARAAEAVAMRFSKEASTSIGSISIDNTAKAKQWTERAKEYRKRATGAHAPSIRKPIKSPYFSTGMHNN